MVGHGGNLGKTCAMAAPFEIIERSSTLPVSAEEAFAWHERPGAFERLTPVGAGHRARALGWHPRGHAPRSASG